VIPIVVIGSEKFMTDFRDYISGDSAVQNELKKIENRGFILTYRTDRLVIRTHSGTILLVCFNKMQIYAFVKNNISEQRNPSEADEAPSPTPETSAESRIAELQKTISRLRERGRLAVAQRDEWQQRALAAEQQLATGGVGHSSRKYQQLKNALAKEFHPDHSSASGIEKIIRTETFKLIWAKIEEIDRS
jgi:hypothetical protein